MNKQQYADPFMEQVDSVVAIDPGNSGAIAHYDVRNKKVVELFDMPMGKIYGNSRSVWYPDLLKIVTSCEADILVVERVMTSSQQGPKNAGAFMMAFMAALSVGPALGVPTFLLNPAEWKAYHGLQGAAKKSMSTKKARVVFKDQPEVVAQFKNLTADCDKAEASLMAKYFADIKLYTRSLEDALW